ncbi:MAG: hypothetical protein FWD31_14425, partial [Planctomycetaceae bacterium]|nr:hypothetical protein [Planctomycetaceae bacterium]
ARKPKKQKITVPTEQITVLIEPRPFYDKAITDGTYTGEDFCVKVGELLEYFKKFRFANNLQDYVTVCFEVDALKDIITACEEMHFIGCEYDPPQWKKKKIPTNGITSTLNKHENKKEELHTALSEAMELIRTYPDWHDSLARLAKTDKEKELVITVHKQFDDFSTLVVETMEIGKRGVADGGIAYNVLIVERKERKIVDYLEHLKMADWMSIIFKNWKSEAIHPTAVSDGESGTPAEDDE